MAQPGMDAVALHDAGKRIVPDIVDSAPLDVDGRKLHFRNALAKLLLDNQSKPLEEALQNIFQQLAPVFDSAVELELLALEATRLISLDINEDFVDTSTAQYTQLRDSEVATLMQ